MLFTETFIIIRFLCDTPERVWGLLDEGSHLRAAERLLAARVVRDAGGASDTHRFPLLKELWPQIEAFATRVPQSASSFLTHATDTASVAQCAAALVSIAAVEGGGSSAALERFLGDHIAKVKNALSSTDVPIERLLTSVIETVQRAISRTVR